jgi:hypothetical protein
MGSGSSGKDSSAAHRHDPPLLVIDLWQHLFLVRIRKVCGWSASCTEIYDINHISVRIFSSRRLGFRLGTPEADPDKRICINVIYLEEFLEALGGEKGREVKKSVDQARLTSV